MAELTFLQLCVLGLLTWIGLGLSVVCALLWRHPTRAEPRSPRAWEVVDLSAPRESSGERPSEAAQQAYRLIREVQQVPVEKAPWEDEVRSYQPSVSFPEEWAYEWPDEPPRPAPLPDEEER